MNVGTAHEAVDRLVSEFLELMPESTRRLVYLSAIPNAIHPELLQRMLGEALDAGGILEALQEYYLINKGKGGWFSYTSEVRAALRSYWKQPGQQQEFQRANGIALAYFAGLARQTSPPGRYVFEREALYHRLLQDEAGGLETMAELFETACDQRQIGVAQNFSIQLTRTLPELSPLAAGYASYYEMRLDFLLNRRRDLEGRVDALLKEMSDPLLQARALVLLGQVLQAKYEWKKSRQVLKTSLDLLKRQGSHRYAARAMLALGDVYVDLVENCGGIQPEGSNGYGRLSRFLTHLLFLPFLLLNWLRRKIWFLPGWFYFGGNYQEWILNYLLQMAGSWYRRARRMAQKAGDEITLQNALRGEANAAMKQRREAKARRIYSRLGGFPAVLSSPYRFAQILLGKGQVSLMAGQAAQARQELQSALGLFQSFADEENIGLAAHSLGSTYLRLADPESAAAAFLTSFGAYREMQDPVSQTQVSWELERLVEEQQVASSTEGNIKDALSLLQEKHYLARFPSDLLRRFRRLAFLGALPLSYLLIFYVGMIVCLALIAFEYSVLEFSEIGGLSQSDVFFLIFAGVLPILISFWIIEIVYAALGQAWVLIAGHLSLNSLGEQPERIVLTPDAIVVDGPGFQAPQRLLWTEIQKIVSADYMLWRRPIDLFSRQGIAGASQSIVVQGITSGYRQICREIAQRVAGLAQQSNADIVILRHPSTYLAVLFALLHACLPVIMGQIEITVENENTGDINYVFFSLVLVFFVVNILLIFPPLIMWRVNLQRRFFHRHLGLRQRRLFNLISFGITILLTVIALLWLSFSPFLKVNESDPAEAVTRLHWSAPGGMEIENWLHSWSHTESHDRSPFMVPMDTGISNHKQSEQVQR